MKNRIFAVIMTAFLWLAPVQADTLDVPLYGQEKDNWCWDASCQMVLDYYGHSVDQSDIADWAVEGYNVPNHLSSTAVGPLAAPGTPSPGTYNRKGCALVLTEFGPVYSSFLAAPLTEAEIKEEIDGERPAILLIRWIKKAKDVGGHIIVLRGYTDADGATISLNDPWPTSDDPCVGCAGNNYIVARDDMFDPCSTYSGSVTLGNRWSQTLKTGRSLDLCFLIDTTFSMSDDIDAVKDAAVTLIDDLTENYKNLRIAVVDYRDYPEIPYGLPGTDYITNVDTPFTDDMNEAKAAIDGLDLGNGWDDDEAVFSALIRTMNGNTTDCVIGGWRKDAERRIILMGDAPGHNPEPWPGGYSYADVLAYWLADPNKVSVYALLTAAGGSYSDEASDQFGGLAAGTGGSVRSVGDSNAGDVIKEMVDEFTETPRTPRGDTQAFKPVFTFTPPTESMGPSAKNILLELQNFKVAKDPNKSAWKNYKKVTLPLTATTWTPIVILPRASYRWRVGYTRPGGVLTFPDGTSEKMAGATLMEPNWTEFTRVRVAPSDPTQLEPDDAFTALAKVIHYQFTAAVNASSYAMEIWHWDIKKLCWTRWKSLTVKPSAKDPNSAEILDVKVSGHIIDPNKGAGYRWRVESLNYDRPKIDPNFWVGLP